MELYILRHADAEPHSGSDRERALTEKGRNQSRLIAKFLRRNEIIPDIILSSPYLRAWQTAEIVTAEASLDDPTLTDWLSCGMSPEVALKELSAFARVPDMMIVGHQPDLGQLVATLLGLSADQVHVRKGALVGLEIDTLKPASARLLFSVPAQLM